MNNINIQNGFEFYKTYHSLNRHVLSKRNGWRYDVFREGIWNRIDERKFVNSPIMIDLWSGLSIEVIDRFPSINRLGVLRAFAMTFFNNNNKFHCTKYSASDIIVNYEQYKVLLNSSVHKFDLELGELAVEFKSKGISLKSGLSKIEENGLPYIMYLYYQGRISITTLYILNNMFKASNPNKLSLMQFLRNVNQHNIFIKVFASNIDIWELMFDFDYSILGKKYIGFHNDINSNI
jgi:hypothetical protein